MAKITIIVSMDITNKAQCVVEVEEEVEGSHGSPEQRAKDHVIACLAIGADIPWTYPEGRAAVPLHSWDIEARRADEELPAPPVPRVPRFASAEGQSS